MDEARHAHVRLWLLVQVQDLKAENANGLSDPIVYVEVMGQKQHTKVKKNTLSCVFDDLFFFNFKGLEKEELEEAVIKVGTTAALTTSLHCTALHSLHCTAHIQISVFDANFISKNELIGAFTIDATHVYLQEHHEVYKQVQPPCHTHTHTTPHQRSNNNHTFVAVAACSGWA